MNIPTLLWKCIYREKVKLPNHGHFQRGLQGELWEQKGVISEHLGCGFRVKKLLTFGKDVGELADAALQFAHRVIGAQPDSVLLAAPFHRQGYLFLTLRRQRTARTTCHSSLLFSSLLSFRDLQWWRWMGKKRTEESTYSFVSAFIGKKSIWPPTHLSKARSSNYTTWIWSQLFFSFWVERKLN